MVEHHHLSITDIYDQKDFKEKTTEKFLTCMIATSLAGIVPLQCLRIAPIPVRMQCQDLQA